VAVQISTQAPSVEVEAYVRGVNTPVLLDPVTDGSVGRSAEETLRVPQALRTGELRHASWRPGQPILLAA
jgi:hypothetical protein